MRAWKNTEKLFALEKMVLRTRNATLTRAVANSKPRIPKQPEHFAEALRKLGGPVLAGQWPRMGSPMELKPAQAAAKHNLT